jgi:tetratricopeptide (TPR) repeat protein
MTGRDVTENISAQIEQGRWKDALGSASALGTVSARYLETIAALRGNELRQGNTPLDEVLSRREENPLLVSAIEVLETEFLEPQQRLERLGVLLKNHDEVSFIQVLIRLRLADLHLSLSKVAPALEYYESVCELCERLEDSRWKHFQVLLKSFLGRMFLKLGHLELARKMFQDADIKDSTLDDPHPGLMAINRYCISLFVLLILFRGLLLFAEDKVVDSRAEFESAIGLCDPVDEVIAINNIAMCCIYSGRLLEAVSILEDAVRKNPSFSLQPSVVKNLSILYSCFPDVERSKVTVLRKLTEYYFPESTW